MTVLKEVSLPGGTYFAPSTDIASQVEIDQIAEFYSLRHNMHIYPLGSGQQVTPRETVYVVAHGNAMGGFTKLSIEQLRQRLKDHGVVDGQKVVLAGCFTREKAVAGLPEAGFQVQTSGFEGVLNVTENGMSDLVNDEESGRLHSALGNDLERRWIVIVADASREMLILRDALTKQNANEVRDYFESGMCEGLLRARPIKFGNATSGASAMSTLVSWLNNTAKTSWRNELWLELFRAMSILARFNDYLVFDTTSPGTGKAALLLFARRLDELHTRMFVEAEQSQARYQLTIENRLPSRPLDPNIH